MLEPESGYRRSSQGRRALSLTLLTGGFVNFSLVEDLSYPELGFSSEYLTKVELSV